MELRNQIKEHVREYVQKDIQKSLVTELWATRQTGNKIRVKNIAKQSGLPLIWMGKAPGLNGEKGI
ncbi:MAG: hypothetical protein KKA81_04790, partial [Bacteroidetes bacterium]|nr:hypothetical protein [Bacteroidota bacterium]